MNKAKKKGAVRELNPRPLAPEARIIPLDQRPTLMVNIYAGLYRCVRSVSARNEWYDWVPSPHGLMDKAHPS